MDHAGERWAALVAAHPQRTGSARSERLGSAKVRGLPLDQLVSVVLDGVRVVSDTALHRRCLALATGVCLHLIAAGYRIAVISRDIIRRYAPSAAPRRRLAPAVDPYRLYPVDCCWCEPCSGSLTARIGLRRAGGWCSVITWSAAGRMWMGRRRE